MGRILGTIPALGNNGHPVSHEKTTGERHCSPRSNFTSALPGEGKRSIRLFYQVGQKLLLRTVTTRSAIGARVVRVTRTILARRGMWQRWVR